MLACAQEIFFKSEDTNALDPYSDHKDKRARHKLITNTTVQNTQEHIPNHNNNKEKEEQQVWPPDVEAAFIEALETIPKLGRRKILVNGKPCGRNELISDFIFRKTSKIRTRKQVSSHIQVLKNTRKGDPHFMRLLTDSVEVDEGYVASHRKSKASNQSARRHHIGNTHMGSQKMNSIRSSDSLSSDESSSSSSPSPVDYIFDIPYNDQQTSLSMLDIKDPFYEPFFGSLDLSNSSVPSTSNSSNTANMNSTSTTLSPYFSNNTMPMSSSFSMQNMSSASASDVLSQLFSVGTTSMDSSNTMTDILEQQNQMNEYFFKPQKKQRKSKKLSVKKLTKKQKNSMKLSSSIHNSMHSMASMNTIHTNMSTTPSSTILNNSAWIDPSIYPLWPNYICLYLEYSLPYDPTVTVPHTLANLSECLPNCIPSIDVSIVAKDKCPSIFELTANPAIATLSAKVKLNMNMNMTDFFFNNTSFFETRDRRTIECTTTIYSFGNVVLESKEVQQALWVNEGKYMYSFAYVNQFFDAFMKGIRSLQSWGEVDIAINNLCVVQVFEDVESKFNQSILPENMMMASTDDIMLSNTLTVSDMSPLLIMVYEFERGQGNIEVAAVETLSSRDLDFLSSIPSNIVDI
ncbi:TEA/ATTS domain family-domain-containing protein [Pilobolus umbonatus]|nr:TEA/ATTS domain family-domain-containing protein [Pilobolus umbonatus]